MDQEQWLNILLNQGDLTEPEGQELAELAERLGVEADINRVSRAVGLLLAEVTGCPGGQKGRMTDLITAMKKGIVLAGEAGGLAPKPLFQAWAERIDELD